MRNLGQILISKFNEDGSEFSIVTTDTEFSNMEEAKRWLRKYGDNDVDYTIIRKVKTFHLETEERMILKEAEV